MTVITAAAVRSQHDQINLVLGRPARDHLAGVTLEQDRLERRATRPQSGTPVIFEPLARRFQMLRVGRRVHLRELRLPGGRHRQGAVGRRAQRRGPSERTLASSRSVGHRQHELVHGFPPHRCGHLFVLTGRHAECKRPPVNYPATEPRTATRAAGGTAYERTRVHIDPGRRCRRAPRDPQRGHPGDNVRILRDPSRTENDDRVGSSGRTSICARLSHRMRRRRTRAPAHNWTRPAPRPLLSGNGFPAAALRSTGAPVQVAERRSALVTRGCAV